MAAAEPRMMSRSLKREVMATSSSWVLSPISAINMVSRILINSAKGNSSLCEMNLPGTGRLLPHHQLFHGLLQAGHRQMVHVEQGGDGVVGLPHSPKKPPLGLR